MPQGFVVSGNVPVDWTVRDKRPAIRIVRPDGKGGVQDVKTTTSNAGHVGSSLPFYSTAIEEESSVSTVEKKEESDRHSTTNSMSSPSIPTKLPSIEEETENMFTTLPPEDTSSNSLQKEKEEISSSSTFSFIPKITVAPTHRPRDFFSRAKFGFSKYFMSDQKVEDVTFVSQGTYVHIIQSTKFSDF